MLYKNKLNALIINISKKIIKIDIYDDILESNHIV